MITSVNSNIPVRTETILFQGINRNKIINEDEWSELSNIDTKNIPAISPRKPMKVIREFKKCNGYLVDENKECWVDGTDLYYDGKKVGTLEDSPKKMVEFNRNIIIFPDKIAYNIKENKITEKFKAPDLEHIIVKDNRIWGTKGVTIHACKLGDYTEWDKPTDVLDGVYYVDVPGESNFQGITIYGDKLVFFKKSSMYELFGKTPKDYELYEAFKIGCVDYKSISEVAGTLFFTSQSGTFAYGGGIPRPVSTKLNETYLNSTGISDNRNYFLSLDNGERKRTYMFDTYLNAWTVYSDKYFDYWGYLELERDRKIRAVSNNKLYEFESGNEMVEWLAISKEFDNRTFQRKSVRKLKFKVDMPIGSELSIYMSRDGKPFRLEKTFKKSPDSFSSKDDLIFFVPMNRAKMYQIKLVGKGDCTVYGEREIIFRSDK